MKQQRTHLHRRAGLPAAALGFLLAAMTPHSRAADLTWNGAGDGTTMSSGANWVGGVAPVANDGLIFDGAAGFNLNNDFAAGTDFAGLTFNAGAGSFTLSGNAIDLVAGVTNHSVAAHTNNAVWNFVGNTNRNFHLIGNLVSEASINGNSGNPILIKSGPGTLVLGGTADNAYGRVTVNEGVVTAAKVSTASVHALGNDTIVNSNGVLRIAGSGNDQVFWQRRITLNQSGKLQLWAPNEEPSMTGSTSYDTVIENGLADTTNRLTWGSNNGREAIYNGTIQNGAAGVLSIELWRHNNTLLLNGTNTYTGTTWVNNTSGTGKSKLIVNGKHTGGGAYTVWGSAAGRNAALGGSGIISAESVSINANGFLSPGGSVSADNDSATVTDTPAVLTISNAVNLTDASSSLEIQLNGATPGTGHDQVAIEGSGTFSNNSAGLRLVMGYTPVVGDKIVLVKVQGTNSASTVGTFASLNGVATDLYQGAIFVETTSGQTMRISYRAEGTTWDMGAGKGNDIMLEVINPVGGANLTWRGNGTDNNWDVNTTANWWNGTSLVTFTNSDFAVFDDSGSNSIPVNLIGGLTPTKVTVNATNDYVFGGSGYFVDTVIMTKTNTGKLSIVTDNINYGATVIQAGTLEVGTNGTTGTLSGNVSIGGNGTLAYNHSDDKAITTAAFSGTGAFVHNGSGKLNMLADLSAAFTGRATNTGGVLEFGDGTGTLGQLGGELWVQGTNAVRYFFSGGNADIKNSLAGTGTVAYENATGGTIHIATTAVSSNFAGTNVLIAGVRVHGSDNNLGHAFGNGSTVNVPDYSQAWCDRSSTTYNNTFNIAGNGWIGVSRPTGAISVFGCTLNGLINLTANARIGGTISGGTILAPITGNYQLEIWGNAGSFVLSMGPTNGVHSYAATLITEGSVRALNTNAISSGPLTIDVAADLRLNGNNLAVASLASINSGLVTGPGAIVQNTHGSAAAALTVGADNSSTTFDGFFLNGGNGALGLTKVGAGTFTVSGLNSNTGPVIVNGGTLALSGSGSFGYASQLIANATLDVTGAGGTLTLNSGQTLGGGGNVMGEVIAAAGSTVSPGASVGTLTVSGNVSLNGLLHLELNRTNTPVNCDRLVSSGGTITYGGALLVTNIGPALQVNDTFQLFPSGVTGFGGNISLATTDANGVIYTWQNNIATLGSVKVLSVTAPVNPAPTSIVATVSGGSLTLTWPADHTGWTLQTQTNSRSVGLNTNWFDVAGSQLTNSVSLPIDPVNPSVFYRLFYVAP